jgi:peptidoglycan/xylan/chitin deacetylase (PgdA/CDA1 family)
MNYINKKNRFYHGIMFHHFHDGSRHKKSQGSLSGDQLFKMIKYFKSNAKILSCDIFIEKLLNKELKSNEICLTFDDGLRCQYDIALPVLEDFKIKAFFNIYSSLLVGKPDLLEIYKYFRTNYFKSVDDFYKIFFKTIESKSLSFFIMKNNILIESFKKKYPFYSLNDIKFRVVRNNFLSRNNYERIMEQIFKKKKFQPKKYFHKLFMDKKNIQFLHQSGHKIGLHTHSHPTFLEGMSFSQQFNEYNKCRNTLSKIIGIKKTSIDSMAHPCGSYNLQTLKILKNFKIKCGFKQVMQIEKEKGMKKINNSNLEIAREDPANLLKIINVK